MFRSSVLTTHFTMAVVAAVAAVTIALLLPAGGATAADNEKSTSATQERTANDAEKKGVLETLAKVGCKATIIEKENANLFEVDDATCEIGKYDIKLDGKFAILSMTRD